MAYYHSLAGKKGFKASKEINETKNNIFIGFYTLFPKTCKTCGSNIDYEHRRNDYCSEKCYHKTVKYRNSKRKKGRTCVICGRDINRKSKVVCSQECSIKYKRIDTYIRGKATKIITKGILIDIFGYKCSKCGMSEWMGEKISLEAHHIDGDAYNNQIYNVDILCPNCHSQTGNYKNKNKNCTRKYRKK